MKYFLPFFALAILLSLSACGASKELTAESAAFKSALEQCRLELSSVQEELTQARTMAGGSGNEVAQLQADNQALRNQLTNMQSQLSVVTQQMQASSDDYGVWFRVQIGAYEDRRIDNSSGTTDQLSLEMKDDIQKIALGRFRNYDDAKKLQTQLKAVGLKDAWVVSYKDGMRVPIEEVIKK